MAEVEQPWDGTGSPLKKKYKSERKRILIPYSRSIEDRIPSGAVDYNTIGSDYKPSSQTAKTGSLAAAKLKYPDLTDAELIEKYRTHLKIELK